MKLNRKQRRKLIEKRNQRICERFRYWSDVKRRRTDDVLHILSEEEFFLSETTIWNIVKKNLR